MQESKSVSVPNFHYSFLLLLLLGESCENFTIKARLVSSMGAEGEREMDEMKVYYCSLLRGVLGTHVVNLIIIFTLMEKVLIFGSLGCIGMLLGAGIPRSLKFCKTNRNVLFCHAALQEYRCQIIDERS